MDMSPLILILTPILLPVVKLMGVDPVHFGMIMMVNLGIGLITPPVGTVLFVGSRGQQAEDRRRDEGDDAVFHRALHRADDGDLHSLAEPVAAAGRWACDDGRGPTFRLRHQPSACPIRAIEILDERFLAAAPAVGHGGAAGHRLLLGRGAGLVRRDGRFLLFSDIPNNRILRWDDCSGCS